MMAQPLDDRIAAALKPGSRLADCEGLLGDVRAERERLLALQSQAEDQRSDPTLTEAEAAEANLVFEETRLRLIRIERAESSLVEAIETKKTDAAHAEAKKRYERIEHTRDVLVRELREHVPALIDQLAAYCQRVADSDQEIEAINRALPEGCKGLTSAEQVGRGYAGIIWDAATHVPVTRLVDLKLPLFDSPGMAWPVSGGLRASDAKEKARRDAATSAAVARRNAEREASRARYSVTIGAFRGSFPAVLTDEGTVPLRGAPVIGWMYPAQVEENRAKGFAVELLTDEASDAPTEQPEAAI